MKPVFFIAVVMALAQTTAAIASGAHLPVSVVEHERLQIRGVTAEAVSTGIEVNGWVRRDNASYAPISLPMAKRCEPLNPNGKGNCPPPCVIDVQRPSEPSSKATQRSPAFALA